MKKADLIRALDDKRLMWAIRTLLVHAAERYCNHQGCQHCRFASQEPNVRCQIDSTRHVKKLLFKELGLERKKR